MRQFIILFSIVIISGCATVHQPSGFDLDTMGDSTGGAEDVKRYDISIQEAIRNILYTCYDLGIPLYTPLTNRDGSAATITSGNFIATLGVDCGEAGPAGAIGEGSDKATGIIAIKLSSDNEGFTEVRIYTQFTRTQSTAGGRTKNVIFESTGRIENEIYENLQS